MRKFLADVYVTADGDGTYDTSAAPQLVATIINDRIDTAIGVRANVHANACRDIPGAAAHRDISCRGLVLRLPTAILCTGLVLLACMSTTCGLVLDSLARFGVEQKRMVYLALTQGET